MTRARNARTRIEAHPGALCTVHTAADGTEVEIWESVEEALKQDAIRAQLIETARQLAETAEENG